MPTAPLVLLGGAVCLTSAREGADVAVIDILTDEIRKICRIISSTACRPVPVTVDVSSPSLREVHC